MPDPADGARGGAGRRRTRTLAALVVGQIGLHSTMTGVRLAAPLQALREGRSVWMVGVLMALFAAAPVLLALPAGRLADRHGYHRPMRLAVALTATGALLAALSSWLLEPVRFDAHLAVLCMAAVLCGCGANTGLIAIQRTAGRMATDAVGRVRVFSWLGLAPSLANMVGPVAAGALIDASGFRLAYGFLCLLPLLGLWSARQVPVEPVRAAPQAGRRSSAWRLWLLPGMRRLLVVNWLLSACWDAHTFAVPILGHERGFSASTIGWILGVFPLAVTGVRLLIPLLAYRLDAAKVLTGAMLGTGLVFALYPLLRSPWSMMACAGALGLSLGSVQPMIMSSLHQLTPHDRHGEVIALRSMTLNASSTVMPLLFGAAGAALGVGPVFWAMAAAVGSGAWVAAGLRRRLDAAG